MFQKPFILKQLWYRYKAERLLAKMQETFGADTRLGLEMLRETSS
jgi:hypothetical protein